MFKRIKTILQWLAGSFDAHYPPTPHSPEPDSEPLVRHGQGDYKREIWPD